MNETFDLGSLIWIMKKYIDDTEFVTIFEDEQQYWLINEDGSWATLNKKDPEGWLVERLVFNYFSLLYAANSFTDEEWETKDYTIAGDAKSVTVIIKLVENTEYIGI